MEDISLHILDIAENSINAGATLVKIALTENRAADLFSIEIEDNGRGIPEDIVQEVLNPFYTTRTTRRMGLGLPLLCQSARDTGGDVSIKSKEGEGTSVKARFRPGHIDMKPLGDMAETLVTLIAGNPGVDFVFTYRKNGAYYSFDSREIKDELDGVPINAPDVVSFIRDLLRQSLSDMRGKVV